MPAREAMCVRRNTEMRLRNHCCSGKATSIIYYESVAIVFGMQSACVVLSSVTCLAVRYVSTLSYKPHGIRENLLNIKCAFTFSLQLYLKYFSL
jgi:hypothetical protein